MRVAIVGGPGIGKSTLIRQLGDLYHNGTYGEGEEGVWDRRMLEDIAAGRNAVGVTEYFARIYDANYRDAAEHDRPDRVIFFEGARITLEAHMAEYQAQDHPALQQVLSIGDWWNPEKVIVLTSSVDTIEKHIRLRNRPHEAAETMVRRFRLIDAEFRRLAPGYPNTVVVNRDGMEFHTRQGLTDIIKAAGLPMFGEIPYRSSWFVGFARFVVRWHRALALSLGLFAVTSCAARSAPVVSAPVTEQMFANAIDDLARLAQSSNEARFDALSAMLKARGIPFDVEPFTIEPLKNDSRTEGRNVVVTIRGREPEIVIGAHYDAVRLPDGTLSKGTVDNAASVLILVRLAETWQKTRPASQVRIVFFDMEELGLLGSARYAQDHRDRKTRAMVNLDVNAFGDTLIFGPRSTANDVLFQAMRATCVAVVRACVEFPRMPPSDDLSFQKAGIPTLSLAAMPELQAHQLLLLINGGKESGLQAGFAPQVLRTIHTAADTPSLAEPRAMAQAYRAVLSLIDRLDR